MTRPNEIETRAAVQKFAVDSQVFVHARREERGAQYPREESGRVVQVGAGWLDAEVEGFGQVRLFLNERQEFRAFEVKKPGAPRGVTFSLSLRQPGRVACDALAEALRKAPGRDDRIALIRAASPFFAEHLGAGDVYEVSLVLGRGLTACPTSYAYFCDTVRAFCSEFVPNILRAA